MRASEGGSPCVRDTRIQVHEILESLTAGMSPAEIFAAYPGSPQVARRNDYRTLRPPSPDPENGL
ncbi:MAG: DUF433 domain-containing protein [Planctomycetes bacterium]|nr:DUF433 domain-containing protein [Planctomycetota bacterium]